MPNLNQFFEGAELIVAGVYYADNVSNVIAFPSTGPLPLIYVGYGDGPAPKTPVIFNSLPVAEASLRNGPASAYLQPMFQPSPDPTINGVNQIIYIEAGANTQSTFSLKDATSTVVISGQSAMYGVSSNLLQVEVQSGTLGGSKITFTDDYSGISITKDNLGIPMQLAYLGSATTVTYTVSGNANGVPDYFVVTSTNPGESFTIPLGPTTYSTVSQVAAYLNGTGYYSANTVSDSSLPSTSLDIATAVPLPSGTTPPTGSPSGIHAVAPFVFVNVTAYLGDPVYWMNTYAGNFVTNVSVPSGIVSSATTAPSVLPNTNFTGGQSVPPLNSDYALAFVAAESVTGWSVFADSNNPAVVILGTQHAELMSTITEKSYRRFFSGSSVGDPTTTAQNIARSMNSENASYVYPGIQIINTVTGLPETEGGLYVAAAIAGITAGNRIAEPLTNKSINGIGVEVALNTTQINALQQAGIIILQPSPTSGLPILLNDFTTWQEDNNVENVLNQQVACRYATAYYFNNLLQPYIGQIAAGAISLGKIKNQVIAGINNITYTGPGSSGWIATWNPSSLNLSFNGTTMTLSLTLSIVFVGQNRFLTTYVTINPLLSNL